MQCGRLKQPKEGETETNCKRQGMLLPELHDKEMPKDTHIQYAQTNSQ